MGRYINICNVYIAIWVLYNFHWCIPGGVPQIDRISNILLGFNILLSIVIIIRGYEKYGVNTFLKEGYVLLILMFLVYGVIYLLFGEASYVGDGDAVKKGSYLIGVLRTFLPIWTFYFFAKKRMLTKVTVQFWFVVFLLCTFFMNVNYVQGRGTDEFTNNTGYWFMYLIPFVFFFKRKPLFLFGLLALLLFLVIGCFKRGAILISIVLTLWVIIKTTNIKTRRGRYIIVIATIFLIVGSFYLVRFVEQSDFLRNRIELAIAGDDSGRGYIQKNIRTVMFEQSSVFNLMFGYGADGTLRIGPNYAHNDWYEILANNGLVGVAIFLYFWIKLLGNWKKIPRDFESASLYGSCLIICFMSTLFSMFYSTTPIYVTMLWGYSYFLYEQELIEKKRMSSMC